MKKRNQLKRTLYIAAAATIATSNQANAFIHSNAVQCLGATDTIPSSSSSLFVGHKDNTNPPDSLSPAYMSSLSDQTSIPQQETLPLIESSEQNELSEFLGRNLSDKSRSITCDASFPLLMTLTDEQREFELMLGKALDT